MNHRKTNNQKCVQEDRLKDIEKDIGKLDEKQDKADTILTGVLTELKYLKWMLGAMLALATAVAIELFKIL